MRTNLLLIICTTAAVAVTSSKALAEQPGIAPQRLLLPSSFSDQDKKHMYPGQTPVDTEFRQGGALPLHQHRPSVQAPLMFNPGNSSQNLDKMQSNLGPGSLNRNSAPPQFDPSKMPANFDPSKIPANFDPSKMPSNFGRARMPANFDPSKRPGNSYPSRTPLSFDPTKFPGNMDPNKLQQNFYPRKRPSSFDPNFPPPILR